jgi:hypothetical protein
MPRAKSDQLLRRREMTRWAMSGQSAVQQNRGLYAANWCKL